MSPLGLNSQVYSFGWRIIGSSGDVSTLINGWRVTRIQAFANTAAATLIVAGQSTNIDIGGSICLEPGGAHKSSVRILGNDYKLIIEFWFPTKADGTPP